MWKIAVGFIIFAGLAIFILSKGGNIDMGGEKHGIETTPESVVSSPATAPASASASK